MGIGDVTHQPKRTLLGSMPNYPWVVVGLLWFCGFFNYADRQALSAVVPLLQSEFLLTNFQVGVLITAFMIVYAFASPFTGYTVDFLSRRLLIALGLGFWSLICAATAFSRNFLHLVLLRGSEGLGESFYFPASMSILADYHGPRTRSRAMSIHQTSVYLGTVGGWSLGGALGERFGWRSPFWTLGLAGMLYALLLGACLIEPVRDRAKKKAVRDDVELIGEGDVGAGAACGRPPDRKGPANHHESGRRRASLRVRRCKLRGDDVPRLASLLRLWEVRARTQQLIVHRDILAPGKSTGRNSRRRPCR